MQTIVIAGGGGFIGSHLVRKLLNEGNTVISVDNFITGNEQNIREFAAHERFKLLERDITTLCEPFEELPDRIDAIFHLASPASPNKKSPRSYITFPIETLRVNSYGTDILLQIAHKTGAKFLFASTSEVYGDPKISPQPETYFGNVNPNGIRSVYDEAKRFGEAMTFGYVRKYRIDARIVRIFNTYGPNMQKDDGRVISNFINQALTNDPMTIYGDGSQTRSFCYVSDMVEGLSAAMFTNGTTGEVFNLGNTDERNVAEIATIIKEMTKSKSEIVHEELPADDPKVRRPDIEKANTMLRWNPTVSLEEGLQKTISYFRGV
jgi:nucleoside-diphosphate-sugar epimerase